MQLCPFQKCQIIDTIWLGRCCCTLVSFLKFQRRHWMVPGLLLCSRSAIPLQSYGIVTGKSGKKRQMIYWQLPGYCTTNQPSDHMFSTKVAQSWKGKVLCSYQKMSNLIGSQRSVLPNSICTGGKMVQANLKVTNESTRVNGDQMKFLLGRNNRI